MIKLNKLTVFNTLSLDILLHVTILFTFLSVFFTKYSSIASSQHFNEIIKNFIDNNLKTSIKEINYENTFDKLKLKQFFSDNLINKNSYDYYVKLFSKDDMLCKMINDEVLFYIRFINILLILFVIFFLIYLIVNNLIVIDQILHIFLENFLIFIIICIIEYLFYINIAIKYTPAMPSLMFTSFIENLKNDNLL